MAGSETGRLRFPKARRIRRRREFLEVQSGARRGGADSEREGIRTRRRRAGRFLVLLRPRVAGLPGRIGITVSSKIGHAVRRNRIRLLVREAYRTTPGLFPEGQDVVVIAATGEGEWTLAAVKDELGRWK